VTGKGRGRRRIGRRRKGKEEMGRKNGEGIRWGGVSTKRGEGHTEGCIKDGARKGEVEVNGVGVGM